MYPRSIWQRAVFRIIKELQINNKTDIQMEEWAKAWPYLRLGKHDHISDMVKKHTKKT